MTGDTPGDDVVDSVPRDPDLTVEIDRDESHSEVVVRAVASLTNTSILELEPLYHTIDADHLDGFFAASAGEREGTDRSLAFGYGGCEVVVTPEKVHVRERDVGSG